MIESKLSNVIVDNYMTILNELWLCCSIRNVWKIVFEGFAIFLFSWEQMSSVYNKHVIIVNSTIWTLTRNITYKYYVQFKLEIIVFSYTYLYIRIVIYLTEYILCLFYMSFKNKHTLRYLYVFCYLKVNRK